MEFSTWSFGLTITPDTFQASMSYFFLYQDIYYEMHRIIAIFDKNGNLVITNFLVHYIASSQCFYKCSGIPPTTFLGLRP